MKTILCVADSTAGSVSAINYLIELVQLLDARVILFHNIEPSATAPNHLQLMDDLEERNEYIALLEQLKGQLEKINPKAGITFDVEIRHGLPQETIPALVKKEQVDLVVFCNEEAGNTTGTLPAAIRSKAACPVLVVPPLTTRWQEKKVAFATALQHELYSDSDLFQEMA